MTVLWLAQFQDLIVIMHIEVIFNVMYNILASKMELILSFYQNITYLTLPEGSRQKNLQILWTLDIVLKGGWVPFSKLLVL